MLKCGRKCLHLAPRLQRQSHRLANGHQQILTLRNRRVRISCQSFRAVILKSVFNDRPHTLRELLQLQLHMYTIQSNISLILAQICVPVMISIALGRTQNHSYCWDLFLMSPLFHILHSVFCPLLILFLTFLLLLARSGVCLCPNDREIMRSEGWIMYSWLFKFT